MDGNRFDSFAKLVGRGASRRAILKGLLGISGAAAVGGTLLTESDARSVRSRPSLPPPPPPEPTPTPTTSPPVLTCTGGETPCERDGCCDGQCTAQGRCCPTGRSICGEDCCGTPAQCCDNECCADGAVCCDGSCVAGSCCDDAGCPDCATCTANQCTGSCDAGLTCCSSGCVDLSSDFDHCGACEEECRAPNDCTTAACIASDCVITNKPPGTICDDGNLCTQDDECDGLGDCSAGSFTGCAISTNPCIQHLGCNPATGLCDTPPDPLGTPCDSGNACFENEECDGAFNCVGDPVICDNTNKCAPRSCDPNAGCVGFNIFCDDDDLCTSDRCVPETGECEFTPIEDC